MHKKSSIALFIAATSAIAISSSVNSGENDMGGLKEWNTDMEIDADFVLDAEAKKLADDLFFKLRRTLERMGSVFFFSTTP